MKIPSEVKPVNLDVAKDKKSAGSTSALGHAS